MMKHSKIFLNGILLMLNVFLGIKTFSLDFNGKIVEWQIPISILI